MVNFLGDIFKVFLITCLLIGLTVGVWIFHQGNQSLDIPESNGISFWELIQERWRSYKAINDSVSSQAQFLGCENNILRLFPINFKSAARFTYACFQPDSELANAFKYWEVKKPDQVLPTVTPIKFIDMPNAFWSYFSAAYWRGLVSIDHMSNECALGPMDEIFISNKANQEFSPAKLPITQVDSIENNEMTTELSIKPTAEITEIATQAQSTSIPLTSFKQAAFRVGDTVKIYGTENQGLRVREDPGLDKYIKYIAKEGDLYRITDGPFNLDDFMWWRIQSLKTPGSEGWSVENFLEKASEQ